MEEKERAIWSQSNGKIQTNCTPIVMNAFSLQNKLNNNVVNTQGIALIATDNRVPAPKPTIIRYEGKITLWTAGSSWVFNKSLTDSLKGLRKTCVIQRADVRLIKPLNAGKMLLKSIDRLIKTGILIDWLLLKCEATNIQFTKVHDEVEIYSVNDFKALKHVISQSTCLPLPFIHRDVEMEVRYFFINFKQAVNSRISKLNSRIFYDADGNKEILVTCDMGIRLEDSYFERIKKFRFHVGKTLVAYVTRHMVEIKRLIVYNHILFGYLQDWIKHLHLDFCKNYSLESIASSLSLHKISLSDVQRLSEGRNQVFFVTAVSDFALYVRFTPSTNAGQFTFEIDNIETTIVSTCSIVQFYRQFFYINDETKTNALECLLDYASLNKIFLQVSDVIEFRPRIKARTVEEINQMVDKQQERVTGEVEEIIAEPETEMEKEEIVVNEDSVIKLINRSIIDKDTLKDKLLPFVKQSLEECYARNPVEMLYQDETTDTNVMVHKFQEAVNRADKSSSFHSFLEHVYHSLQLCFTNATCQKIMNCMIYKELENRYTENSEESVGAKELKEKFTQKPEASPKMPTLMPLKEFLKLEREKDVSQYKLKPCSVKLKKIKVEEINFMLKLPKNSAVRKRKLSESEESVGSDASSTAPKRKSQKFWDEEKLYRECLTSKTTVVLDKIDVPADYKNKDKNFKLGKKEKLTSVGSDTSVNDVVQDCFEIVDGKIKLKPGYEYKDGYIVPVEKIVPDSTISPPKTPTKTPPKTPTSPRGQGVTIRKANISISFEIEMDANAKTETKAKSGGKTKAKSNAKAETEVRLKPETASKSKPEAVSKPETEAKAKQKLEAEAKKKSEPDAVSTPCKDLVLIDDADDIEIISEVSPPSKSIQCGSCSKVFKSVRDLEEHEKISHGSEKTFKCNYCDKRFYQIRFLEFHKMKKHEKTYNCAYCKINLQLGCKNDEDKDANLERHLATRLHDINRSKYVEEL